MLARARLYARLPFPFAASLPAGLMLPLAVPHDRRPGRALSWLQHQLPSTTVPDPPQLELRSLIDQVWKQCITAFWGGYKVAPALMARSVERVSPWVVNLAGTGFNQSHKASFNCRSPFKAKLTRCVYDKILLIPLRTPRMF